MSYQFRYSGKKGIDLIVPTKRGKITGCIPEDVIVPIGYLHSNKDVLQYMKELENDESVCMYTAKYCEREDVMTHIAPLPSLSLGVNRFGIFLTRTQILSVKKNWTIDIDKKGWFRRVTVSDVKEIQKYL